MRKQSGSMFIEILELPSFQLIKNLKHMKEYIRMDQWMHQRCQIITKVNKAFVPAKEDDSHTNLYYDQLGDRIDGRWIETEKGPIILTLNMSGLKFEWLDANYNSLATFETLGKTIDEVEKEIKGYLPELGLNQDDFVNKLHFKIPEYPFANETIQTIDGDAMAEWRHYRKLANEASCCLLGYLKIEGEIRIWPHHFDTGIYVVLNSGMGIGFGLAMSDPMVGSPYFYMSGYPENGNLEYNDIPLLSNGNWITNENWKGAVLPLTNLNKLPQEDHQQAVSNYLLEAINWFIKKV